MSITHNASNHWPSFHLLNALCVVIIVVVAFSDVRASIRLTALVGSLWLAALLAAPAIPVALQRAPVSALRRTRAGCAIIMANRKQLGLWSAAWLLVHAVLSAMVYFDGPRQFLTLLGQQPVLMLELASLAILLLMALTSNSWSRLHVPGWKLLHLMVWAIPGMALVGSVVAARNTLGQLPLLGLAPVVFGLCLVVGIAAFALNRQRQAHDWLRVGFLLTGCLAGLAVILLAQAGT